MCVCTWGKGVWGAYKTHPHPELWFRFHGEVESALKKRLHPVIKDGGLIARHGSDDDDDGPFSPCGSFPWQWVNEILVKEEGGLEWHRGN